MPSVPFMGKGNRKEFHKGEGCKPPSKVVCNSPLPRIVHQTSQLFEVVIAFRHPELTT